MIKSIPFYRRRNIEYNKTELLYESLAVKEELPKTNCRK